MAKSELEQQIIPSVCPITYRLYQNQLEFSLLLIDGDTRWEFPHSPLQEGEIPAAAATRIARELFGFDCQADATPLGEFQIQRNGVVYRVSAVLTQYLAPTSARNGHARRPQRWFLLDEARLRIRRKPMRHCADVAKRRIEANGKQNGV